MANRLFAPILLLSLLTGLTCAEYLRDGRVFSFTGFPRPIVVNTWPWTGPAEAAWKQLNSAGGNAVDAVVAGCAAAENDRSIPTVGAGGSPDEAGNVTLDAMVMDGGFMDVSHYLLA